MPAKKFLAIDFGSKNIHIVEGRLIKTNVENRIGSRIGKHELNTVEISKSVVFPTPANSFSDGKIEDRLAMKLALKNALVQNRIRTRKVFITIQSSHISIREFMLPVVVPGELENMVNYEMEQFLPKLTNGYVTAFKVLEEVFEEESNEKKLKIRAAAMPKDMADSYYKFLKDAGLKPLVMDIHSNAVSKLLVNEFSINNEEYSVDKTVAFIDAGARSTGVHMMSNGRIEFSRFIPLGGSDMDTAIAVYFNTPVDKAEMLKMNKLDFGDNRGFAEEDEKVRDAVNNYIIQWLNEVQKVFQYYNSRNLQKSIDAVYVYGGGSNVKGLDRYMEKFFNIHTVRVESISSIKYVAETGSINGEFLINAAGSVIRQ